MEGTKKIRRPRKRWGCEVEEDLNGPITGAKNKQTMARDYPECIEIVMEGSPQRSAALEEEEEEEEEQERKKEKKEKRRRRRKRRGEERKTRREEIEEKKRRRRSRGR
jgi:hypothetical protein